MNSSDIALLKEDHKETKVYIKMIFEKIAELKTDSQAIKINLVYPIIVGLVLAGAGFWIGTLVK